MLVWYGYWLYIYITQTNRKMKVTNEDSKKIVRQIRKEIPPSISKTLKFSSDDEGERIEVWRTGSGILTSPIVDAVCEVAKKNNKSRYVVYRNKKVMIVLI